MSRALPILTALVVALPAAASAQNLTITSVNAPTEAVAGAPINVQIVVEASGNTGPFSWAAYLTTGGAVSNGTLLRVAGPATLSDGETRTLEQTINLPASVSGQYIIAAVVDSQDSVAEWNEFDNAIAAEDSIRIQPRAVDVVATSADLTPQAARPGEPVQVTFSVENVGELTTTIDVAALASKLPSRSQDRSTLPALTTDDVELGRMQVTLAPGQSRTLTIDGTVPAGLDAGDYAVGVLVDPDLQVAERVETNNQTLATSALNVFVDTLTVDGTPLPTASMFIPYFAKVFAEGGNGRHDFQLTSGTLPTGLQLEASGDLAGTIFGTPLQAGRFNLTVEVTSNGLSTSEDFTLDVRESDLDLTIVTPELNGGTVSLDYEMPLAVAGGEPPYEWNVPLGDLPPGLDITNDGIITGIPQQEGAWTFTISVRDSQGSTATTEYTIGVVAPNVVILSGALDGLPLAEDVSVELEASGGRQPYVWTALSEPPPGLRITEDGLLLGTPSEIGLFPVRVKVTDASAAGSEDTALIHVLVEEFGVFEIMTASLDPGKVRTPYERAVVVEGGIEPLEWTLIRGDTLPRDFELVSEGRRALIQGSSVRPVAHGFTLQVEDASGRRREVTLAIDITSFVTDGGGGGGGCTCVNSQDMRWPGGLGLLALFGLLVLSRRDQHKVI